MSKEAKEADYTHAILEIGKEKIQLSHPDASDFRFIQTKDFVEGKLTLIDFEYETPNGARERGTNLIYEHNGKYMYARNADMLVGMIGPTRPRVLDIVLRPSSVAGILALLFIAIIAGLLYGGCTHARMESEVPTEMWVGLSLILGFYFGHARGA